MIITKKNAKDTMYRVHVLGVGNYFSPFHNTVSFVVQTGDKFTLLESPTNIVKKLQDYRTHVRERYLGGEKDVPGIDDLVLANLNDIIVTHMHGDHAGGLEEIGWYKMFVQEDSILDKATGEFVLGRRPNIYATGGVIEDLVARVDVTLTRASGIPAEKFYNFVTVNHNRTIFTGVAGKGSVNLEVLPTYHGIGDSGDGRSFAVVLNYAGLTLAYSGDTRFDSNLVDELSQADLMIHECDESNFVHTTPAELSKWLNNKLERVAPKLRVCHFPRADIVRKEGLRPLEEYNFIDVKTSS